MPELTIRGVSVNVVKTKDEAVKLFNRIYKESKAGTPHSVDTEFGRHPETNQEYITVWSVSVGKGDMNCLYAEPSIPVFKDWLEDPDHPKVFQNFIADEDSFLASEGIVVRGLYADTEVMSAIVDSRDYKHDLKYLEAKYLHRNPMRQSFKDTFSYVPAGKKKPVMHTWEEILSSKEMRQTLYLYSAYDAEGTARLQKVFAKKLNEDGWDYYKTYLDVDVNFTRTLSAVMRRGFLLDKPYMQALEREYAARLMRTLHVFRAMVGEPAVNPNSPPQLQKLFFEKLDYPALKKTDSGAWSTDASVLDQWAKAGLKPAGKLLEFRELDTLKKTFITGLLLGLDEDGRLYSDLNQTGAAATGRISSRKYEKIVQVKKVKMNRKTKEKEVTYVLQKKKVGGNLQNIPVRSADGARIRRAFIAEPGHKLVISDLAGAEWWMMGHLSKDPQILKQYQQKIDPHADTASFFFKNQLAEVGVKTWQEIKSGAKDENHKHHDTLKAYRGDAKSANFGFIYMCAAPRAAELLALEDGQTNGDGEECSAIDHGQWFIDKFYSLYGGIRRYQAKTVRECRETGYVYTLAGRRLQIPEIWSDDDGMRGYAERAAVNGTDQGSIADIVKAAMNFFELGVLWPTVDQSRAKELKESWEHFHHDLDAKMLLQVHDEIIFTAPDETAEEVRTYVEKMMPQPYAELMDIKMVAEAKKASNWSEK